MKNNKFKIQNLKFKISFLCFVLSIAILLLTITLNLNTTFSEENEETEEVQTKTHFWGKDICPVNVLGLTATSYIDEDFSKFTIEDYEYKIDEFSYKLKNSLINELSEISYDQYGTSIDFETMAKITDGENPPLLKNQLTVEKSMKLLGEINDCFSRGVKIATAVQEAIIATETQNYITNSLLKMNKRIQEVTNRYRTDHLEKEAKEGSRYTSYPLNPLK